MPAHGGHVAQDLTRRGGSAIDERTTRHGGYQVSQRERKRIEECFGWLKTIALMRKVRHRGLAKVGWVFNFAAAAYNLVCMRKLLASPVGAPWRPSWDKRAVWRGYRPFREIFKTGISLIRQNDGYGRSLRKPRFSASC
jgi:hypothetical protein